jgi:hypothetical protein
MLPHLMNKRVRQVVSAKGGTISGEEYFPVEQTDYRKTVDKIISSGAQVVFNTIVPPGLRHFSPSFTKPASQSEADTSSARTSKRTW